ncbi:hypothetical protein DENSPDRAFT_774116 [Dentipellis sp. KUC8613]|nr:hypothetical protein DENSPDRAFT_774116 [Dentipellis sp. KUC8613]
MSEDHEDVFKSRDLLSSPHARSVSFQDRSSISSSVTPSAAHPAEPVLAPVESAPESAESEPVPAPAESVSVPVESALPPVPVESVSEPVESAPIESVPAPAEATPAPESQPQTSFGESATREDFLAPQPADEPDVPNPFLVDDPEEPITLSEPPTARLAVDSHLQLSESQTTIGPAEDIPLSADEPAPEEEAPAPAPLPASVDKPVPAPPQSPMSSESSDADTPAIYLPQLVHPTMFLPIPNTDPLTTLLMKYIPNPERRPRRDLTGDWTRSDFHTLVMTNSWRALARMARDRLVQTDPEDLALVLSLWYLRLSSLARLRLFNQTSAETTNLFTALETVAAPAARAHLFDTLLPFELEVLHARLRYWAGDARGYLDALGALLAKCRRRARRERSAGERQMWIERAARVGLIAASQFVEMKDYAAATRLLEPLLRQPDATSDLRAAVARVYLQAGQIGEAERHFAAVAADAGVSPAAQAMNAALVASARGEWATVGEILKKLVEEDPENFAAVNNLSVALLSQGSLKEGTAVLEAALQASPSTLAMAEPFLFNLSTLYELRSAVAADKKRDLLIQVAQWSGDGLRTTCLKMPTA